MPSFVGQPGSYVEEVGDSRTIPPAPTSVAVFVGMADRGPVLEPTRVPGIATFESIFGAANAGEMADQLRQYFVNGGGEAWVCRTPPGVPRVAGMGQGRKPDTAAYLAAFSAIESTLAGFNLMILPRAAGQTDAERHQIRGPASACCARKRAILLVDPDSRWTTVSAASAGVAGLRAGVDTRHAALWWPRLKVGPKTIDPSGSIAGVIARTDARFGVWKAPAGSTAALYGVTGVEVEVSDEESGILNPQAINVIRSLPPGILSWGARMMAGFDGSGGSAGDRYVPVRRMMLFIGESLARGLKFATFEPNAEPLWAAIRLVVDGFLNDLMRWGAFAGTRVSDAYFIRCDETTTTDADRALGIVRVVVGFAPLKPAEFVVLTVRQTAGQPEG